MPIRTLTIDPKNPYEAGAAFFSLLAFPHRDDDFLARAQTCLCHQFLESRAHYDAAWAWSPQPLKPGYAFMDRQQVGIIERQRKAALDRRLQAAHLAIGILGQAAGFRISRPASLKRLSLNELSGFMETSSGFSRKPGGKAESAESVQKHAWRPSRPVLHLAVAVVKMMTSATGGSKPGSLLLGHFLWDGELLRETIRQAEALEPVVLSHPKMKITDAKLIRVRIV